MKVTINGFEFKDGDFVLCKEYHHDGSPWYEFHSNIRFGEFWIESEACHGSWQVIGWYIEYDGYSKTYGKYPISSSTKLFQCDNPE